MFSEGHFAPSGILYSHCFRRVFCSELDPPLQILTNYVLTYADQNVHLSRRTAQEAVILEPHFIF